MNVKILMCRTIQVGQMNNDVKLDVFFVCLFFSPQHPDGKGLLEV